MNINTGKDMLVSLCFTTYTPEIMANIVTIIAQIRFFMKELFIDAKFVLLILFIVVIIFQI
jgi:hypothetical protein